MFLEQISDDLLISLFREGNQVAIDLLYERYNVFLYGFIHKILKREYIYCEYKDLFQEVFIVFLNCIERYDEECGCFYYFVKKCVDRKLFDYISKFKRNNSVFSLDNEMYDDGVESCVDYVEESSTIEYYETELYKNMEMFLSEEQMKIIDMRVEGYSYEEISSLMGISKQCIYRKMVSIKNIIKDIIEKID